MLVDVINEIAVGVLSAVVPPPCIAYIPGQFSKELKDTAVQLTYMNKPGCAKPVFCTSTFKAGVWHPTSSSSLLVDLISCVKIYFSRISGVPGGAILNLQDLQEFMQLFCIKVVASDHNLGSVI